MFFHSAGISKGAFCGLIALLFVVYVGAVVLYYYQNTIVYDQGYNDHKHRNSDWIEKAYYSYGVLGSLGGILAGQIRRVYPVEHNLALPPLRNSDCASAIVSCFVGNLFMAWGLTVNDANQDGIWTYSPYIFIFLFIATGTHAYLRIQQDARQWAAIALITVSLFLIIIGKNKNSFDHFSGWAFTFFILSVISYSHFWVKLEFILKRRACNVFEVTEKFGIVLLTFYTVCIVVTSIFQWCTGHDWITGIYIKSVFTNVGAFFLTILVPFVLGAFQLIILSLIYNSSAIRFLTIFFMPVGISLLFFTETSWVGIVGHVLFFAGLVVYNATTVCGSQAIQEQKIEMAYDAYEDEHFKRVQNDGQVDAQYSANNMV